MPPVAERFWRVEVMQGAEALGSRALGLRMGYAPERLRFFAQGEGPEKRQQWDPISLQALLERVRRKPKPKRAKPPPPPAAPPAAAAAMDLD